MANQIATVAQLLAHAKRTADGDWEAAGGACYDLAGQGYEAIDTNPVREELCTLLNLPQGADIGFAMASMYEEWVAAYDARIAELITEDTGEHHG